MRRLLLCAVLGLAACNSPDWRSRQIDLAEQKMRAVLGDPSARFYNVQLTGDQTSGQSCGQVTGADGQLTRFIVYIDTVEPYMEGGPISKRMPQDRFDSAWRNDCLAEGYTAP
jgi:hypothetical protein